MKPGTVLASGVGRAARFATDPGTAGSGSADPGRTAVVASRCSVAGAAFLASVLLLAAAPATTQAAAVGVGAARLPVTFRTWEVEESGTGAKTTLSQLHVPVVGSIRLGPSADLVLSTAYASSELEPESGDGTAVSGTSLAGNGDVKAQLFLRFLDDRFLLQGGVGIPAGTRGLDPEEELPILQALSEPLLGFRMKHYGEGLDLSAGTAVAFPLGPAVTAAFGGGFVARGAYEFVADQPDFQPGTEASVSAGLDFSGDGAQPAVRLDASYRMFAADRFDDEDVFQEGNQIELQAVSGFRPGRARFDLSARIVLKEDNSVLDPPGADVEEIAMDAGTAFFAQAETGLEFARGFLGVGASLTHFDGVEESEETAGSAPYVGTAYGIGPVLELGFGGGGSLRIAGQVLVGSVDLPDPGDGTAAAEIDLSGFDVALSLGWAPTLP